MKQISEIKEQTLDSPVWLFGFTLDSRLYTGRRG